MKLNKKNNKAGDFINPFKSKEIKYWADQWNINMQILKEAMGVTGSSRVTTLKNFLQKLNYIRTTPMEG